MKNFIKKRLNESIEMELIESLMGEDYPSSFDIEKFKSLRSFADRIKYCEEHLKRISSGTSRIAYIIDETKVLKLAKNRKGLAQNETEIQWGNDYYFESVLAHTFDGDENGLWVEMELARKPTKDSFKQILGYSLDALSVYLRYCYYRNVKPNVQLADTYRRMLDNADDEENIYDLAFFSEDSFANTLVEFMDATKAPHGDLAKYSSYGVVKREGQDTLVLIDFGLTGEVYGTYYS